MQAHQLEQGTLATWMCAACCNTHSLTLQAYQLEQGTLAKWCTQDGAWSPPTAVLVHGILGSKRNLQSFTRRLLQEHPAWQVCVGVF